MKWVWIGSSNKAHLVASNESRAVCGYKIHPCADLVDVADNDPEGDACGNCCRAARKWKAVSDEE